MGGQVQGPLVKGYSSHEDGSWVPPGVYTEGDPGLDSSRRHVPAFVREGHIMMGCLRRSSLSLGVFKHGYVAMFGGRKEGPALRELD